MVMNDLQVVKSQLKLFLQFYQQDLTHLDWSHSLLFDIFFLWLQRCIPTLIFFPSQCPLLFYFYWFHLISLPSKYWNVSGLSLALFSLVCLQLLLLVISSDHLTLNITYTLISVSSTDLSLACQTYIFIKGEPR